MMVFLQLKFWIFPDLPYVPQCSVTIICLIAARPAHSCTMRVQCSYAHLYPDLNHKVYLSAKNAVMYLRMCPLGA